VSQQQPWRPLWLHRIYRSAVNERDSTHHLLIKYNVFAALRSSRVEATASRARLALVAVRLLLGLACPGFASHVFDGPLCSTLDAVDLKGLWYWVGWRWIMLRWGLLVIQTSEWFRDQMGLAFCLGRSGSCWC